MAKKPVSRFVCNNCGAHSSSWAGRCSVCGEWNTLVEEALLVSGTGSAVKSGQTLSPVAIIEAASSDHNQRILTNIKDVDVVLGGGLVRGSVTLIAGQPGIGKSTLLMQIAGAVSKGYSVLYVSGEESVHQVAMRASRLGSGNDAISLVSSMSADDIARTISTSAYDVVIVDSIQTIAMESVSSVAGSVSQITNCAHLLIHAAKTKDTALILVGHVTKEGSIAGPKVLEHVVDTVLQLEGDRYGGFKVLRSIKNRFGSTNEAGIFEMVESGLRTVENPSEALLSERQITDGSIVLATMEGSRPVLVEVQALVNQTSYGYPKRAASGIDLNRLNVLIAMLERRTKLDLADKDVYINIVGGIRIQDPGLDLAVCMAIGSASKGMVLNEKIVVFGEVGLSGEVRHVPFADKRLHESKKLGYSIAIGPAMKNKPKGSILKEVKTVKDALNTYLV